jgi:sugar phosphate isomerase/epimerase
MRGATVKYCVSPVARQLLINAPYHMLRANMERITALRIGVEVYLNNQAVNEIGQQDARQTGKELQERGIVCTIHAPFMDLSPGGVDREVRSITLEKLKKAVEIGHYLGAKGVVCHGGYDKWRFGGNEQLWLDGSIHTWTEVLKESGDLPVLVENIFEENPSTLIALFGRFKEKNLWFCFDTGHFNLFTTLPLEEWLMPLKDKLREFHIHDNHGRSDEHLPVGRGTFPFRDLKRFLQPLNGMFFTAETSSEAAAIETIKYAKEFLS